jgi:hypothetical protein
MSLNELLDDDLQDHDALKDFTDPTSLARSFIDTQKKIGAMVSLPGSDADVETSDKFYHKLGKPESAESYSLESTGLELDKDAVDQFKGAMHSLNLTQDQAQGLVNYLSASTKERLDKVQLANSETSEKAATDLRITWGADYDRRTGAAENTVKRFFGEGADELRELAARNPAVSRGLAEIGVSMSENSAAGDSVQGDPENHTMDSALAKIREYQVDEDGPYRNRKHPSHAAAQAEVERLYAIAYPG